jgi:ATP-independent RNA helicase DbpA
LRKQTLDISRINCLVLDEADRMLEMGFIEDMEAIVELAPATRQTLLFSATFPADIQSMSARFQRAPAKVAVAALVESEQIDQRFFICQSEGRMTALATVLGHFQPDAAVVFCNTKQQAREVCDYLRLQGISAAELHGDMEQRDRDQVLVQFRQGSRRVLVATDVAARGLDIDNLAAVVNFELPRSAEVYVHRIGRTGRGGKSGLALSLFTDSERYRLDAISQFQQRELPFEAVQVLAASGGGMPAPDFVTLVIAGGRKDKVRRGDILGALTGDAGIAAADVGKIDVMDQASFVAITSSTVDRALGRLRDGRIKGRKFKVRKL